jgi:hypothetical protein
MVETNLRLAEPGEAPGPAQVKSWIGPSAHKYWKRVADMINRNYPDVFQPEWLYGGKKHGWSLRYKKSKSFCTFIPEKNAFRLLIVFGAKERDKVEAIRAELSPNTRKAYDDATTYHDGKWLRLKIDNDKTVADVERLLAVKRRPKK